MLLEKQLIKAVNQLKIQVNVFPYDHILQRIIFLHDFQITTQAKLLIFDYYHILQRIIFLFMIFKLPHG